MYFPNFPERAINMNFQPLDYTNYNLLGFILITGSILAFPLILWAVKAAFFKKELSDSVVNTLIGVGIFGTIAAAIIAGAISSMLGNNAETANKFHATQNIMQKYDVADVQWDSKQTNASPISDAKAAGNEIVVTASNRKAYVFIYELNTSTSEPTLKDMPIAGGAADTNNLSADDLLKK